MSNLKQYSDNQLVERMRGSKVSADEAFTEIYNRYSKRIHTYCICMMQDRDDAKDVFQETFIRFYRSFGDKFICLNLAGYLYSIARNNCINFIKRRNVILPIESFDGQVDMETVYENKELFDLLLASVNLLDEKYKEPFILREFDGLSYKEIADVCGLTIVNAKTRVLRAKEKVLQILEPYLKDYDKKL
jgi:RNA polymerase sigma-70 factor, ECF subfamily